MTNEPSVVERPDVPYVAITATVSMNEIGAVIPPLNQEVFGWLAAHGEKPAGAPLWKYNVVDMARGLEIEAGVPTERPVDGDDRVRAGVLPAGRYATLRHVGHPRTLVDATARLLRWAEERGLTFDVEPSPAGDRWRARLEIYHDEPGQPMDTWETELAFRLTDPA
jgi:effector-binding domain-containing protein